MSSKHFLPIHRKLLTHGNNRQFEKYPRSEENLRSKLDPFSMVEIRLEIVRLWLWEFLSANSYFWYQP